MAEDHFLTLDPVFCIRDQNRPLAVVSKQFPLESVSSDEEILIVETKTKLISTFKVAPDPLGN